MQDWLPELVLLNDYGGNWDAYLGAIYQYFRQDFVNSKPAFRGTILSLKHHPLYDGKEATFWHLISEGSVEAERLPDLRRCERIRWPRPIIEHDHDPEIKFWKNLRKTEVRMCLWCETEEYLVILAERRGYILLWTAYPVTQHHRKRKLQKEYDRYWQNPF
jgi:hypothetical protein